MLIRAFKVFEFTFVSTQLAAEHRMAYELLVKSVVFICFFCAFHTKWQLSVLHSSVKAN